MTAVMFANLIVQKKKKTTPKSNAKPATSPNTEEYKVEGMSLEVVCKYHPTHESNKHKAL